MKGVFLVLLIIAAHIGLSQTGTISGVVSSGDEKLEFVNLKVEDTAIGVISDNSGYFKINNLPFGKTNLIASYVGYKTRKITVELSPNQQHIKLNINLVEHQELLDRIVITGTKTSKRQTQSPVIVNVIDIESLNNVQACNLSDGLKFQPGLRVETDCQTCNYTQLRMNGLGGGYSQILINGRPIFSPLTGLYGMEQIPANMIERIEVVRGGGSALYGSSAIGGTVNVITRIPSKNSFEASYTYNIINGEAEDKVISGNATVLTKEKKGGMSIFINSRNRQYYDHNGDNFSELPQLKNNSFGTNLYLQVTRNQKLEVSLSSIHESRYGGEMITGPPHLALQAEERTHDVLIGSLDYQINFNNDNSSFISYVAGQNTYRNHYTGIIPDDSLDIRNHLLMPPYGTSKNLTLQGGVQFNHRLENFINGANVLTIGAEFVADDVYDVITAYNYEIDQFTKSIGLLLQSDWEISPSMTLLTGLRMDKHNFVNRAIFSPRVSILYKLKATQFRLIWGMGFRAPQAFDADLHIAFAGGGVSRISLSPGLAEERSNSLTASVNFDKATKNYIFGYTIDAFYTKLDDAFYLHPVGSDDLGELFEKRNGEGAAVQGLTLDLRANYRQKVQLETGFTAQTSLYESPVQNIEGLASKRAFLRTPNLYGFGKLTFTPTPRFSTTINLVYTGRMELVHFAGAPEHDIDSYITTPDFTDISFKTGYTFIFKKIDTGIELLGGIKNITNAYQSDFDSGKNRDSNYVYGPGQPRTFFLGLKIKSI